MRKNYYIYFWLIIFSINITGCEPSNRVVLKYKKSPAQKTTKKERVEFCHTLAGDIKNDFTYRVDEHRVYEIINNIPYSFCSYIDDDIKIGITHRKDLNQCHTLTKAEVRRGGRVTYIEHNPKYSTYKDGNIYWSCKYGSKPDYVDERKVKYVYKLYRYNDDENITLIKSDYYFYYHYQGTIFRRVAKDGKAENFNVDLIKVTGRESFSNKVIILDD